MKSAFLRDGLNQWLMSVPLRNNSELKILASQLSHGSWEKVNLSKVEFNDMQNMTNTYLTDFLHKLN